MIVLVVMLVNSVLFADALKPVDTMALNEFKAIISH